MDPVTLQKKVWQEPTLVEYGDVVHITQDQVKEFGIGDGFVLQIGETTVPIRNAS